jgi:hypothetical protein
MPQSSQHPSREEDHCCVRSAMGTAEMTREVGESGSILLP